MVVMRAVHLLNVTDKGRYQPVLTAGYGMYSHQMLKELTNAGSDAFRGLVRSSGVKQSLGVQAIALLVVGARAQVDAEAPEPVFTEAGLLQKHLFDMQPLPMLTDAGPSSPEQPAPSAAPERLELGDFAKLIKTMLSTCRPGTFGERKKHAIEGLSKTAPIGSGCGLLLWTTNEKKASGKGSKVTDETKRCVRRHTNPHLSIRPTRHSVPLRPPPFKAAICHRDPRAQGQGRAAQAGLQSGRGAA